MNLNPLLPTGPQLTNMLNPGCMGPVTPYDAYQYQRPVIDSTITARGVNYQPIRDGVYARDTIGQPISPTFGKPHSYDTIGQPDYIYPARVPKHNLTSKFDNNSFNLESLKPLPPIVVNPIPKPRFKLEPLPVITPEPETPPWEIRLDKIRFGFKY